MIIDRHVDLCSTTPRPPAGDLSATVPVVFGCRFLTGFAEGVNYPVHTKILGDWMPPHELSRGWGFAMFGQSVGTIVVMGLFPLLANWLGWEAIFYVSGAMGLVWLAVWVVLGASTPAEARLISHAERQYILDAIASARGGREDSTSRRMIGRAEQDTTASILRRDSRDPLSIASSSNKRSYHEYQRLRIATKVVVFAKRYHEFVYERWTVFARNPT